MSALSQDSLAVLALTNRLQASDVAPLKASEVWRLLDKVPEPSTLFGLDSAAMAGLVGTTLGEGGRLARLLDTGVGLAVRLDALLEAGIIPVTAVDAHYPHRLRERLSAAAPPVLYCAGELSLLDADGIGVVGSRDISPEAVDVTRSIAEAIAAAGLPLVSGGARGVDRISMSAALEAGGRVVGVLPDSLEQAISRSENRKPLLDGTACLCTPYRPDARFTAGNAMGRNKIVYGLSRTTIVVASAHEEGGTWAGATEAIKKRYSQVAAWVGPGAGPGNLALVRAGAVPIDRPDAVLDLRPPVPDAAALDQMQLAFTSTQAADQRSEPDEPATVDMVKNSEDRPPFDGQTSPAPTVSPPPGAVSPQPTGMCWCGCGKDVEEGRFFLSRHAAGAAQRAVVKHFGSVEAFLTMLGENPASDEAERSN